MVHLSAASSNFNLQVILYTYAADDLIHPRMKTRNSISTCKILSWMDVLVNLYHLSQLLVSAHMLSGMLES